ncbi:S23-interacting protein [Phlyctochytrium planicorne]|nr:S23-interacting protein [Phlyctochytrium planicorne]
MRLISLPTTPVFRQVRIIIHNLGLRYQINNDILADVLFFFSCFHGPQVLQIVADVLNDTYAEFMKKNPNFNGVISILGHSLGGIISYDILANQHHATQERSQRKVPQAYRTEPLVDPRYAEISPVLLQRPSSTTRNFRLDYYRSLSRLFSSYIPSFPDIQIFRTVSLPSILQLQLLPQNLTVPNLMPSMPSIPTMPSMSMPSMPTFSSLGRARKYMVESVYSFAASSLTFSTVDGEDSVRKRAIAEEDLDENDYHASEELSDTSMPQPPPRKRRRIAKRDTDDANSPILSNHSVLLQRREPPKARKLLKQKAQQYYEKARIMHLKSMKPSIRVEASEPTPGLLNYASGMFRGFKHIFTRRPSQNNLKDEPELESSLALANSLVSPDESQPEDSPPTLSDAELDQKEAEAYAAEDAKEELQQKADEDALTEKLAEAAARALKKHPSHVHVISDEVASEINVTVEEDTESSPLPLEHRTDFFFTENVMDNMVHQYFIGMKAHFCYWNNKDLMHHLVRCVKTGTSEDDDETSTIDEASIVPAPLD